MAETNSNRLTGLREKAEFILKDRYSESDNIPKRDVAELIDEIQVYQVELEIQNEELRRAQKELERSRDRLSLLYHKAPVGYVVIEESGIMADANRTLSEMVGRDRHELLQRPFSQLIFPDDRAIFFSRVKAFFRKPGGKVLEVRFQRGKGGFFHARLEGRLLGSSSQSLNGVDNQLLLIVSDITGLKESEEARDRAVAALRGSEERLLSILESISEGFFTLDEDLTVTYFNGPAGALLGRDPGDVIGKALLEAFPELEGSVFEQKFTRALRERKFATFETWFGAEPYANWYEVRVYPSREGVSVYFQVTTERKKLEQDLRHAHKMEAVGTLAGGLAHDFNNILFMITGNVDLALLDLPEWSPVREKMEAVKVASMRAAGIVKQVLNFSRAQEQELKSTGIVSAVKEALKFMRSTIPATIEVRAQFPEKELTVLADPVQIHQVLMNICTNASQSMEETGGVLRVSVDTTDAGGGDAGETSSEAAGEYVRIAVADTGPGIPPEIIDRIFDPYFTTKDVDSSPGKGAAFTILIPTADGGPDQEMERPAGIFHGTERILFVDDEAAVTDMVKRMLERMGYQVEARLDPLQALERFEAGPYDFDLVVTDMTMPGMTGAALTREVKAVRPDIPVIVCTGYSALIDEDRAAAMGIEGYIVKPVVMKDMARTIRAVLDERRNGPGSSEDRSGETEAAAGGKPFGKKGSGVPG